MWKRIREHPLLWGISTAGAIIVGLAQIWPTLTRDTVPEFLASLGWTPTGYQLAIGLLAVATVAFQFGLLRTLRRGGTSLVATIDKSSVEFFETRDALSRRRPLNESLESAPEVWALWNAGTEGWAKDAHRNRRLTRLLLPNPYAFGFDLLANAVKRSGEDVANDIRGFTKDAARAGVEVRWFSTLPGNTLTIGDPEGEPGWVQVEAVFHGTSAQERFSVRFDRRTYPKAFRHLKQSFEAVWSDAMMPEKAGELETFRRSVEASEENKTGLQRIAQSLAQPPAAGTATESASRAAARRLGELSGYAVEHLLNRTVTTESEQDTLDDDRHAWMADIVAAAQAGGADPSDIARLKHIGTYTAKGLGHLVEPSAKVIVPGGIGPLPDLIARNIKHRNEVAERNERLIRVIEKLEKR
jgi:hypothetical protein